MKISVHCVVKNEDRWLWYALQSVIDYVDEINIIDTGSTDDTIKIINSFKSPKINFSCRSISSPEDFTAVRKFQLDACDTDWILILDGDEVWPETALKESITKINQNPDTAYLVNKFTNLVGDVHHRQPNFANKYHIGKQTGPLTIRFVRRNLPGLHWSNPYGSEGLADYTDTQLQNTSLAHELISDPYLHCTHLPRSSVSPSKVLMRSKKFKYELGIPLPKTYIFPKPFYLPHPIFVPTPWHHLDIKYWLTSALVTPVRYLKRLSSYA